MHSLDRQAVLKLSRRSSFTAPLPDPPSLSAIFHENTKLGRRSARAYFAHIESFLRQARIRELLTRAYKTYTLADRRDLPQPAAEGELRQTLLARRSVRRFTGEPVLLAELSDLLRFTYGRTDERNFLRPVASGGALYPLEVYVAAMNVDGLDPGFYHYAVEGHQLDVLTPGDPLPAVRDQTLLEGMEVERAALMVIFTAAFRRSTAKYLDRGYRMILMEAGAAAHTLCLLATSRGLGACQVGGFYDDELAETLGLDGIEEAPLVPVLIGRAAAPGAPR